MNGGLIMIVLVIAVVLLALLTAKIESFWRGFTETTRFICFNMDHADSHKEYRRWRGELRCHYLCLIPFVNGKNVMRLYRRIYHRDAYTKKQNRKDSFVPLLFPSVLGIFICTVCVCGMTWAWYTASIQTPNQKMTAAYYEVTVESITSGETKIEPTDGIYYSLEEGTTYAVTLRANGSVKGCGGYCLIENAGNEEKIYTQTFKPGESITIQLKPTVSGNYIFTGVWGSLPASVVDYLQHIDPALNSQTEILSKPAEETNLAVEKDK